MEVNVDISSARLTPSQWADQAVQTPLSLRPSTPQFEVMVQPVEMPSRPRSRFQEFVAWLLADVAQSIGAPLEAREAPASVVEAEEKMNPLVHRALVEDGSLPLPERIEDRPRVGGLGLAMRYSRTDGGSRAALMHLEPEGVEPGACRSWRNGTFWPADEALERAFASAERRRHLQYGDEAEEATA